MINGTTKLMGLIGNPVAHTLSPVIHNTIAEKMGINMIYVPLPVKDNLKDAIKGAFSLQIQGLNVTVPYKTQVIPFLKEVNEKAKIIGAINTLVPDTDGYIGYNTDYLGLYQALISEGFKIQGQKIAIIGAGGSARAAAFLCAWEKAEKIIIINRTLEHAKHIVEDVKKEAGFDEIYALSMEELNQISDSGYLALQATKVGLAPNINDTPISDDTFFERLCGAYDFIYNPADTQFMKLAKDKGIPAYNGLKMLLYQAVESFQIWNQVKVPEEIIEFTYEKLKRELYEKE